MLGVSVSEEDEGTDCEDGDNDSDWCIKCMQLIVKYFFLPGILFLGKLS